jgi:hypothetical protein
LESCFPQTQVGETQSEPRQQLIGTRAGFSPLPNRMSNDMPKQRNPKRKRRRGRFTSSNAETGE